MKLLQLNLLLFLCCISFLGYSQTPQYSKCCGTASTQFPFKSNTANKVQLWYNPVDFTVLPQNGQITKLYFRSLAASQVGIYTNFEILLKQPTTGNQFDALNTFITGMTSVVSSASITINGGVAALDWFEIPLTTPFSYDNTLPLVVEIHHSPPHGGTGIDNTGTNAAPLNKKIYSGNLSATTGTQSNGFWQDFGYDVSPASSPNDAGVSNIIEPLTGCVGTHDVNVEISNFGINQLSNLSVQWSVNGSFQGTVPYNQLLDTTNGSGASVDTITVGTVNFVNNGSYNIKAWTINPNGQPDTINFNDTSSISITGSNYPLASLGSDTTYCPDQPLMLIASSSNPDSVRWNDNSFGNSRVISMSGFYKVDIYKNLCKTEDSINISMHPAAPNVNLGNDTTFCFGDVITLDATATGVTYTWQDNSSNATFNADTLGDYWVTIEDANTCRSSDSIELKLYKDPSVSLFVSPSTIVCFGSTIIFQANGKTAGSEMYQLVINGINVGSPQSSKIFTNPAIEHGDTVRVDLITDQCASAPYPVSSNSFGMTVNPKSVLISGLTSDTVIENTKKNYAISAASGSNYVWRVSGGSIVGDSTSFAVQVQWGGPNPNATLTLVETTSSNCSRPNILPVNIISIDGLNESKSDYLGVAYPNPANESITIPVKSSILVDINLGIYDLTGKEVINIFKGEINGNRNFVLPVSSLHDGMYFYKLTTPDGNQSTRKLLIKH